MQQNQIKELKQNQELMEIKVPEPDILPDQELEKRGIEKVAEDEVFKHIYTSQASQMRYYATNYGRIATQAAGNRRISFLRQFSDKNGYMMVSLSGYQNQYVHRLVADAFATNEYEDGTIDDKEAHHINKDRADNRAVNLIWIKDADHDLLHKIDMISLYSDGQCSMEWHRLAENRMDLEELVKLIDYTEVPIPLFLKQLREQAEHVIEYTGKYSGDRRSMIVKVTGRGLDMPEAISPEPGSAKNYKVVVRLKEEFILEIGKTPLTEEQKEAHRQDMKSGEFNRRMQQSLELQKQFKLFDAI